MQQKQKRSKNSFRLLKNYGTRHLQAAVNSIGQISRAPFTALTTCLVIGIALALPAALFVLLKNVEALSLSMKNNTEITVYLKQNVSDEQAANFAASLKKNADISAVSAISPAQGLKELAHENGQENLLNDLQNNPLPWALVITPAATLTTPDALSELSNSLKFNAEVDTVQMDSMWVQRLFSLMTLAHRLLYALMVFLGIGVLLIVNNCISSATQNSKKEIEVIKLIGGTHAFIRRPFLYVGIVYGLLGGILAWQLVDAMLMWLKQPVGQLAGLYHSQFQLMDIGVSSTFFLLFSSILLGWLGSWVAVTRFLRTSRV
jgi:cell division transport system permease protein